MRATQVLLRGFFVFLTLYDAPGSPLADAAAADLMAKRTIYVYHGEGVSTGSLYMLKTTLDRTCDLTKHDVRLITPEQIIEGSWREDAVLIALGGGYDRGMISSLGDEGQAQIREFVHQGGSYLGFCAGGYFGTDYIEFDKDGPQEVVGPRQLKFFHGKCIGPVFPNFDYFSEAGSHAAFVSWHAEPLLDDDLYVYFNGGGHFVPYVPSENGVRTRNNSSDHVGHNELPSSMGDMAMSLHPQSWDVVSRYLEVAGHPIAVVKTQSGLGKAVLTGIHPEFIPALMPQDDPYLKDKLPLLKASDARRRQSVVSILNILGVQTVPRDNEVTNTSLYKRYISDGTKRKLKSYI